MSFMSTLLLLKILLITLVLLGDFYFSNINWESLYDNSPSSNSSKFREIIFDLNLCQLVNEPTHIHGNILDLVLTIIPDSYIVDLTAHLYLPYLIIL